MGLGTVAAHLIVLIALASAGTLLAGAASEAFSDALEAQAAEVHRLRRVSSESFALASDFYDADKDRVHANWTNEGGFEVNLTDVTLLVDGTVRDQDGVALFELRDDADSKVWLPGGILEVRVDGEGDADLTIVGPMGTAAHRRP